METTIQKGGKLTLTHCKKGSWVTKNVSNYSFRYLYEPCTLADGVTLKDIFLLIRRNLPIYDLVFNNWCKELIEEGFKRTEEKDKRNDIEYLELYWPLYKQKENNKVGIYGYAFPSFNGVGYALKRTDKEVTDGHWLEGTRLNYAIAYSPSNTLIHLPVKLSYNTGIHNEDNWQEEPLMFENCEYTLGHIVQGILWELSYSGSPVDRDKKKDKLFGVLKKIKNLDIRQP